MTKIIDGESIARKIEAELEGVSVNPKLSIVLVGDNPASKTYTKEKLDACDRVGFKAELTGFEEEVSEDKLVNHIEKLNNDDSVHGILVQLPLPGHIDNNKIFRTLKPEKDVDGLTPLNLGKTVRGDETVKPCAVSAIERILEHEKIGVSGKNVTIINNSNLIGKPLSMVLTRKNATVTLCHEKTRDLKKHTQDADIIITATGQPELLEKEMINEDAVIIDAGYSHLENEIVSESEKIGDKPSSLSPVPGGVGPVTVAMTLKNLLKCYNLQN